MAQIGGVLPHGPHVALRCFQEARGGELVQDPPTEVSQLAMEVASADPSPSYHAVGSLHGRVEEQARVEQQPRHNRVVLGNPSRDA